MNHDINHNVQPEVHVTHDGHHVAHNGNGHGNGHDHHHKESFITKYVFSQDHKMIARQFLITGMIWAVVGGLFQYCFGYSWDILKKHFQYWKHFLGIMQKVAKYSRSFIMPL